MPICVLSCSVDKSNEQLWKIGSNTSMNKVIIDQENSKNVKICSDKYKNIGFPVNVNIDYDDKTYFGLIEDLCITVNAKKIRIRFATPSSGKRAEGTFEILNP